MEQINFEEILAKHCGHSKIDDFDRIRRPWVIHAMKEIWNKAIEVAADNAELVECDPMEFYINKESILKLKV